MPRGNRLELAIRTLARLNTTPEIIRADDPATARLSLEAIKTVFEAFVITWTLTERPGGVRAFPIERLSHLGKGHELPESDANTKARDTQFELMTGANLVLGGADMVPQDPPDYMLLYHGRWVGVEAKRLSSLKGAKVGAKLSEAAKQLLGTTGQGFVTLNLDSWIEDLSGNSPEEVGAKFNLQVQAAHREIQAATERQALLGALVFGMWNEWGFGKGKPELNWRSTVKLVGFADEGSPERRQFFEFFGPFREEWEASMAELGALLRPRPQPASG